MKKINILGGKVALEGDMVPAENSLGSRFPVFKAVENAHCYKCGKELSGVQESNYFTGRYVGYCAKCDVRTWFDLRE